MSDLLFQEQKLLSYYRKGVLLDTGPLLLLLVGKYDRGYIQHYSKLKSQSQETFQKLENFVKKFNKVIITPHVLAELSNLANDMPQGRCRDFLKQCAQQLERFNEVTIEKDLIIRQAQFPEFGVTDMGIVIACEQQYREFLPVIQDDGLRQHLEDNGIDYVNFWSVVLS